MGHTSTLDATRVASLCKICVLICVMIIRSVSKRRNAPLVVCTEYVQSAVDWLGAFRSTLCIWLHEYAITVASMDMPVQKMPSAQLIVFLISQCMCRVTLCPSYF